MITKGTTGKAHGSAKAVVRSVACAHCGACVLPSTRPSTEVGTRLLLAGAWLCFFTGSQMHLGTSAFGGKTECLKKESRLVNTPVLAAPPSFGFARGRAQGRGDGDQGSPSLCPLSQTTPLVSARDVWGCGVENGPRWKKIAHERCWWRWVRPGQHGTGRGLGWERQSRERRSVAFATGTGALGSVVWRRDI